MPLATPTSPSRRLALRCHICDYDLRASTDRCPECGTPIDLSRLSTQIPWAHRRKDGRTSAYLKTLVLLLFKPNLVSEIAGHRPLLRDSITHHRLSLFLAVPLSTLLLLLVCRFQPLDVRTFLDANRFLLVPFVVWVGSWAFIPFLVVAMTPSLAAVTALFRMLLRLFFPRGHLRRRANRLTPYLSSLFVVQLLFVWFTVFLGWTYQQTNAPHLIALLQLLIALSEFAALLTVSLPATSFILARRRHSLARSVFTFAAITLLQLLSLAFGVLILFLCIWSAGYVLIAFRSMFG